MKICLLGATHIAYNPRLVREADTLAARGHEVRVVAPVIRNDRVEYDRRLLAQRAWCFQPFDYRASDWLRQFRYWRVRGMAHLQEGGFHLMKSSRLADRAILPGSSRLEKLAAAEASDWFIAHAQAALPVAARAARKRGARLGFDMEDILTLSPEEPVALLQSIESRYLPQTDYVSIPSNAIGARLLQDCSGLRTLTLYNVFPRKLAAGLKPPGQRLPSGDTGRRLRLHWFGQTIGPGRGIRKAIEALEPLGDRVEFHCRGGDWHPGFAEIRALAEERGVPFIHHPLIDHDRLIESLAEFDVGLALEQPTAPHYELTVTNKFFSYLLAGLAIAATGTRGQREVLEQIPQAGFLFDPAHPEQLASGLGQWIGHRNRLLAAQTAAWNAARERFCWEVEQAKFLEVIEESPVTSSHPAG